MVAHQLWQTHYNIEYTLNIIIRSKEEVEVFV